MLSVVLQGQLDAGTLFFFLPTYKDTLYLYFIVRIMILYFFNFSTMCCSFHLGMHIDIDRLTGNTFIEKSIYQRHSENIFLKIHFIILKLGSCTIETPTSYLPQHTRSYTSQPPPKQHGQNQSQSQTQTHTHTHKLSSTPSNTPSPSTPQPPLQQSDTK